MTDDKSRRSDAPKADEERVRAEARLVEALRSAALPGALDESVHEGILTRALGAGYNGVVEPPASPLEARRADALRRALDGSAPEVVDLAVRPLVLLVRALRHAHRPTALDELRAESSVRRALALPSLGKSRRWIGGGVVTAIAVAAAIALVVLRDPPAPPESASLSGPTNAFLPGMVEARSTGDLFEREDFPPVGGTSARIDRIAGARAADQRNNRFVSWGVP